MSKPILKLITNRGAQFWECPFCQIANGSPEMTVCAGCGAVLDGVSARKAEDAGGLNCESWYRDWLETKDDNLYRKIIEYNLDDVRAMEVIDSALKKLTKELPYEK